MLKFFFNRKCLMVRLMNGIALVEACWLIWQAWVAPSLRPLGIGTGLVIFSWLFFNFLDSFPWYRGLKEKWGIRVHFEKNVVPVSYLSALALAGRLCGLPDGAMFPIVLLMTPIYYVSFILLFFHHRDKSTTIPSYFSNNLYLQEKELP